MASSQRADDAHRRTAVIIGAGPAGLTAALELLRRTDIQPVVLEASHAIGGLSRTVEYKGNRIDIGGHRFFSRSERVNQWWQQLLPLQTQAGADTSSIDPVSACETDRRDVLLVRPRQSRIYFARKFFDYPLALNANTLRGLGFWRTLRIAASYLRVRLRPNRPERNLEDFFINRFGRELYQTFFQSYTEKLWGTPCADISADWGAQRIRGLSLLAAVRNCIPGLGGAKPKTRASQACSPARETSLIDQFLYPRLGPGHMWQRAGDEILALGGTIHHGTTVHRLCVHRDRIQGVEAAQANGGTMAFRADFVFSTMPIPQLIDSLSEPAPANVRAIAEGLQFRDFLTVGVLVQKLALTESDGSPLRDNWIYIQEPGVRMTRLQIFNNWSPDMVANEDTAWLGLEYVCSEGDDLWSMPDAALQTFAARELESIGVIQAGSVLDACVVRAPKAYPAYFGTYEGFGEVRDYLAHFCNLFPIGRNGQHRYNNQDHSMLTAMLAVDQIVSGTFDPAALWSVNAEQAYHESR
ncbi:NAD(P)/FAD-dependent oxidoreductase [Terriglobus aquaticus]|uniref:NAD(P)/FAD-dependent oxidoreductase n=1 Tax=Terriglobus aquaticus TaxID=940139 RepID=A0ABW9KQZ1_9BACT|nr:NAD(P)/FAD-dependent oxidoreductase [Terriglobus aquaticus]